MTIFAAFNVIRRSNTAYTHAALHCDHRVTFHTSETAARRTRGHVEPVRIANRFEITADRADKKQAKAHAAARQAAFDAKFAAFTSEGA